MTNGRVVVNISGKRFELASQTFANLLELSNSSCLKEATVTGQHIKEYFFERNATSFEIVLEFLRHGDLHLSPTVCPTIFSREMEFWGIDITKLDNCCYVNLVNFIDNRKTLEQFEKHSNIKRIEYVPGRTLFPRYDRFRDKIWNILEMPYSSRAAKVYSFILAVFVLMSLFVLVAGTHPMFHRKMTRVDWKVYLGDEATRPLLKKLQNYFGFSDYSDHREERVPEEYDVEEDTTPYYPDYGNDTYDDGKRDPATRRPRSITSTTATTTTTTTTTPILDSNPFPEARARIDSLRYMEYATVVFFTVDFIIRNIFSARKIHYFFSFGNITDIFALASVYVIIVIEILIPKEKFRFSSFDIIECIQFLRMLRLVRLLRDVHGVRVLFYSIRSSAFELCFLFSFLGVGVFIFASVIFFIEGREQIETIPHGAWWAVITMTTVGYGDVIPETFLGKIVASMCAICGVLAIGLTVPIFVSNFVMFYSYSKTFEARRKTNNISKKNAAQNIPSAKNKVFPEKMSVD